MSILDGNNKPVGLIKITTPAPGQTIETEQQHIVVGGAVAGYRTRKAAWRRIGHWRLYVMLVNEEVSEPFVVRRAGVGYVYVQHWKNCSPEWKTVILC